MKMMLVAGVVLAVGGPGGVTPPTDDVERSVHCTFDRDIDVSVSGDGVTSLFVNSGSGDVSVEGRPGAEGVSVRGRACASEEAFLDVLDVTATRSGDAVSIETHYPRGQAWDRGSGNGRTASIDLVVIVPLGTEIEISDSSGDVTVVGTGSVTIDDQSGGVEVSDIDGDVVIEDGSGGIDVRGVRGGVLLRDGSGGIDISDVGQDVRVVSDGSGSIRVDGVGGDFLVGSDGSGSIRHSAVDGRVEVPERRKRGRGDRR